MIGWLVFIVGLIAVGSSSFVLYILHSTNSSASISRILDTAERAADVNAPNYDRAVTGLFIKLTQKETDRQVQVGVIAWLISVVGGLLLRVFVVNRWWLSLVLSVVLFALSAVTIAPWIYGIFSKQRIIERGRGRFSDLRPKWAVGKAPNIKKMQARGDIKGLSKALHNPDKAVREAAASALEQLADARTVKTAAELLGDSDADLQKWAARILGQIGSADAVDALAAALQSPTGEVRLEAIQALGSIGTAQAAQHIIPLGSDPTNTIRAEAGRALAKIKDQQAVPLLIETLKHKEYALREGTAQALKNLGDQRAVEPLVEVLGAKKEFIAIRTQAALALSALGWQPGQDNAGIWYHIVREQWDQCAAAGSAAVPVLVEAFQNIQENRRPLIITTLEKIGGDRAIEALVNLLKVPNGDLRRAAASALNRSGWQPDSGVNGARYWIGLGQWEKCVEIGGAAIEPLKSAMKDPDDAVKQAAERAIQQIQAAKLQGNHGDNAGEQAG